MGRANPDGTFSMLDLDNTWLRYMKADKEERKQMCEEMLAIEGIVFGIGLLVVFGGIIWALCSGVI